MESKFDLVIIGGGPGGYVCAIRAAQLGLKTALVEKRSTIGGTCVNVGCIPSKALLDSSEHYHRTLHELKDHGISVGDVKLDLAALMARKDRVVKELTDGLNFLMKKNKITVFNGFGRFKKAGPEQIEVEVKGDKGAETVVAKKCVIATGSEIINLPGIAVDGKSVITSDHAIALDRVPEHLVIIGAGVIGLELGSVWKRLGAKVTIVELLPGILGGGLDKQMSDLALRIFKKQGLEFLFQHKVTTATQKKGQLEIIAEGPKGEKKTLQGDKLFVCVGRRPFADGLGAEEIGVKFTNRGRIEVKPETLETSVPGVYALGDVIDGPMLAHKAEEEGVMIAENLAGKYGHVNYDAVPFVVYTWPEVAWVGRSEEQLKEQGVEYVTGKYLFKPNGRAKAMNQGDGQIKIIADKKTDKVHGIFIVGPNASELIAEATLAMEFGAAAEDIARSFHAHPTLSEVMKEAALAVDKRAIHA